MPVRSTVQKTNFSAGEIDPRMLGRGELTPYKNGAKQLVNFMPRLHGGIRSRFGTDFCYDVNEDAVLAPFEFSESQAYVFAFCNTKVMIFYDDGTLATTINSTPWLTADLTAIRWAQFGDTMFVTHPSYPMKKIVRTGAAVFSISDFAFDIAATSPLVKKCPFYKFADPAMTLTPSATTGTGITLTLSGSGAWTANHVNTYIRYNKKQIKITGYTSATIATGDVIDTLGATTADTAWDEEVFSAVHGYAISVCFHNNRLVFGGSRDKKSGVWISQVGSYYNFDLGTSQDAEAIWAGIAADRVVSVVHVNSFRNLQIYTDSGEFFSPESDTKPLSPTNIAFKKQSGFGAVEAAHPVVFDGATLFIQKYTYQLREYLFNQLYQIYTTDSVSVMNPSRFVNIRSLAGLDRCRDIKEQYALACNEDGTIALFHSLRSQKLTSISALTTNGLFRQVCAVNGYLFVLTKRTINAATKYYLEKANFNHCLDCAKTITVTADGTSVAGSGLTHLPNTAVRVVSNGNYWGEYTTTVGGAITVTDPWVVTSAIVGLAFTPVFESLPPSEDTQSGPLRADPMRISKIQVLCYNTVRFLVQGQELIINSVLDDFSLPPTAKSGQQIFWNFGWGFDKTFQITSDVPLPVEILGLVMEVQ